jgi:hypothetical protein
MSDRLAQAPCVLRDGSSDLLGMTSVSEIAKYIVMLTKALEKRLSRSPHNPYRRNVIPGT